MLRFKYNKLKDLSRVSDKQNTVRQNLKDGVNPDSENIVPATSHLANLPEAKQLQTVQKLEPDFIPIPKP